MSRGALPEAGWRALILPSKTSLHTVRDTLQADVEEEIMFDGTQRKGLMAA